VLHANFNIEERFAVIHLNAIFLHIHPLVNEICTHIFYIFSHEEMKDLSNLFHLFHIRGASYLLSYLLLYIEIIHVKFL